MGWEAAAPGHYPEEWKVARADEWGGLESRCGLRVTMGSNPIPSAKIREAIARGKMAGQDPSAAAWRAYCQSIADTGEIQHLPAAMVDDHRQP